LENFLTIKNICSLLKLQRSFVSDRLKGLNPSHGEGRNQFYDASKALKLCLEKPNGPTNPQVALMEARADLARSQTRSRELLNARLENSLCEISEVEKGLRKIVRACISKLLVTPSKIASQAAGADARTLETLYREAISEAIDELRVEVISQITSPETASEEECADAEEQFS
jgi:hypothetical protein